MNALERLSQPDSFDQSSSMWVDEAIWGHRLYDEQLPWFVLLEFLNVFHYEHKTGRCFDESGGLNLLTYKAAHRLHLRNILFNNPSLEKTLGLHPADKSQWEAWLQAMKKSDTGIPHPEFSYLRQRFHTFKDFCEVVSFVRSTSLEMDSNKRWTSKFVFPYGEHCLYEDLDKKAKTNDRRFFGRTGEILYLMFCRCERKHELLERLTTRFASNDKKWDSIIKALQPEEEEDFGSKRAHAFLPYKQHPCFDALADDWIALLDLAIPDFDVFPHLVTLAGLHLLKYQLTVSRQVLGLTPTPEFICEIVAPKKTLVREASSENYQNNNMLPARAVERYIANIKESREWREALTDEGAFQKCKDILGEQVHWGDDYNGSPEPERLFDTFHQSAMKRHRQHVANIHRNYGREIGLVSRRGTVKLRYAPTDGLLRTLLLANVPHRIELHQFLGILHQRYGFVFGEQEAESCLEKDDFDKKAFQSNAQRLEQRLGSLGLLKRLSDGCAFVINPYHLTRK